jgi:putative peptidoglycan lipid II flippase
MSQMLKSSGAMGLATMSSRLLGMAREILYAWFMGDGPVAGAFKMAFMIPNLFRRLLGEGALTAAFIPLFKEKERTASEEEMWRSANAVISGLIVAASVVVGLVLLGLSLVLMADGPGRELPREDADYVVFSLQEESGWLGGNFLAAETRLLLELLRVMFPYMFLVCLAAMFMGILNARGHFFVPAMGAAVLNGILIVAVLFVAPVFGERLETQIFGVAFGVLAAGVAQTFYQWPLLRREGFRFAWVSPWGNETVRLVGRRMVPGMMGVAAFQLNVLVTASIAYWVNPQIVASFDYAVRLMELPQGVFGISLATFLLPTLAGLAAEKKYPEFRSTLRQAVSYLVLANWIASILLIVLAGPVVRLLFERGEFDPGSTERAAFALACLAPGLIAFSLVNIFARAFYALGDTRTPMVISCFCLALNVVLVIGLIHPFAQGGLAMANSITAILNMSLLLYGLRRKLKFLDFGQMTRSLLFMGGGGLLAGGVAFAISGIWESRIGGENLWTRLGAVFVPMTFAGGVYGALLLAARIPAAQEIFQLIWRRFRP